MAVHTETYTVRGMTCGSCIAEVMELVRVLPGVSGVTLGYRSGGGSPMLIESRSVLSADDLRAALETGGFRVSTTGRRRVQHLLSNCGASVA